MRKKEIETEQTLTSHNSLCVTLWGHKDPHQHCGVMQQTAETESSESSQYPRKCNSCEPQPQEAAQQGLFVVPNSDLRLSEGKLHGLQVGELVPGFSSQFFLQLFSH